MCMWHGCGDAWLPAYGCHSIRGVREGLLQMGAEQQQQKQKQLNTRHFVGHISHAIQVQGFTAEAI